MNLCLSTVLAFLSPKRGGGGGGEGGAWGRQQIMNIKGSKEDKLQVYCTVDFYD